MGAVVAVQTGDFGLMLAAGLINLLHLLGMTFDAVIIGQLVRRRCVANARETKESSKAEYGRRSQDIRSCHFSFPPRYL